MKMNHADFASGAIFCLFGLGFLAQALTGLDIGTSWQMGPGYFPAALGGVLLLLGAGIAIASIRTPPDKESTPFPWRAVILTGSAPLIFAVALRPLGFAPAIAAMAFVSSFSSPRMTLTKALAASLVLTAMCVGIFIHFLGLPLSYFGSLFGN